MVESLRCNNIRDKKGSIKAICILIGVIWLNSIKLFPLLVRPWIKVLSLQNSKFFLSFGLCCYRSGFQSLLIKRFFPRRLGEVVILINSCFLSFFFLLSFNHRGFIIIVRNSGSLSWPLFGVSISYKIGARVEKTPALTGPPRRRQWSLSLHYKIAAVCRILFLLHPRYSKIIIFDRLLRTKYVLTQITIRTKHDREKSRNSISFAHSRSRIYLSCLLNL